MVRDSSENGVVNNGFKNDEMSEKVESNIQISRSVYDQQRLHNEMIYSKRSKSKVKCENNKENSLKSFFLTTFPIFTWIYNYKREYLIGDIMSGATVCTMHIPGMGHALLANLPPVVGIYMGFYPAIVYGAFASSMHNSIGKQTDNILHITMLNFHFL